MNTNYDRCLLLVLKSEGGYVNNRNDPGGATNYGITQRVYDAWRTAQSVRRVPVITISTGEVRSIYKAQYWDACRCDELPAGVDYLTFDAAVNSGVSRSTKWLQSCVGVTVDGHLGLMTMNAIRGINDRTALVNRLCDKRVGFLHALTTWKFFGKGWANRMKAVRASALAML